MPENINEVRESHASKSPQAYTLQKECLVYDPNQSVELMAQLLTSLLPPPGRR